MSLSASLASIASDFLDGQLAARVGVVVPELGAKRLLKMQCERNVRIWEYEDEKMRK